MSFLSLGVVWAGYTLVWYGMVLLRGPGIGILDLMNPGSISKVTTWLSTPIVGSSEGSPVLPGGAGTPGTPGYNGPYGLGNGLNLTPETSTSTSTPAAATSPGYVPGVAPKPGSPYYGTPEGIYDAPGSWPGNLPQPSPTQGYD